MTRQPKAIQHMQQDAARSAPGAGNVLRLRRYHHVVLVALVCLVFLNALPNGLHLDDYYRVKGNPGIQKLSPIWRHFTDPRTSTTYPRLLQFRPLLPLTLSINYAIAKDSSVGYHLGNLLLHLIGVVILYALCLELLTHWTDLFPDPVKRAWLAFGVAAVYGVHPVSGIPVNYVCARDLLLMQCFFLAFLLLYARMRRLGDSPLRWLGILVCLALSVLGKTNAAAAPFVVLVFEFTLARQRVFSIRPWLRFAACCAVIAGFFAYTKLVLGFSDAASVMPTDAAARWQYPLTQLKVHVFEYLRNFVWPFYIRQAPRVEPATSIWQADVLVGAVFVVGTLAAAWLVRRRSPLLSFCILGYWAMMLPESSFMPIYEYAVHYRSLVPGVFFFLAAGMLVAQYLRPRSQRAVLCLAIAFFAGASVYLNTTWRSDRALWTHSVKYGGAPVAHMNLGMTELDPVKRKAHLERAIEMSPEYIIAHINLGLALLELKQQHEGLKHLHRAIGLDPGNAQAHYWLGYAYNQLDKKKEAARESSKAADLDPRNLSYNVQAAKDAQAIGDHAKALHYIDTVVASDPLYEDALYYKGISVQETGDREGAISIFRKFLESRPNHTEAHFSLGCALMDAGERAEAARQLERVLELQPDHAKARTRLDECLQPDG